MTRIMYFLTSVVIAPFAAFSLFLVYAGADVANFVAQFVAALLSR